jgi:hypothetical protein
MRMPTYDFMIVCGPVPLAARSVAEAALRSPPAIPCRWAWKSWKRPVG